MENGRNCSLGAISPLIHSILLPDARFYVQRRTRFSLRDKRLFEITEVEITRVDCILYHPHKCRPCSVYFVLKFAVSDNNGTTIIIKLNTDLKITFIPLVFRLYRR